MVERYAEIHAQSIEDVLEYFCRIMPASVQSQCQSLIATYGPVIVEMLGIPFAIMCRSFIALFT